MKALPVLISAILIGAAVSAMFVYYQPSQQRDVLGGEDGSEALRLVFANATNLTNNNHDSVYGQVAAWNSSVYVVWQDSVSGRNYDIFVKTSTDNGTTFGPSINLSNNPGFSEHPQVSAAGANLYAAWADNTSGNREILFARSVDNGTSFESARNLSNNTSDSHNMELAAFGDNVYLVWLDQDERDDGRILYRASNDGGATFGSTIAIGTEARFGSLPKVAAYGENVYITWNTIGDKTNDGLYFVKSSDNGNSFDATRRLGSEVSGESQVAAYNDTVYVISGGLDAAEVNGLYFFKSSDGGETFPEPSVIDLDGKFVNPLNVEIALDSNDTAYVAGQVFSGGNEEILLLPVTGGNGTGVINLSKNEKISECPSIAISGDNIYVVWEDLTPGNHEVLYAKGKKM